MNKKAYPEIYRSRSEKEKTTRVKEINDSLKIPNGNGEKCKDKKK